MRVSVPRVALAGLAIAVILAIGVAGATSTTAFGPYNPAWDGASQVGEVAAELGVSHDLVRNVSRYDGVPANGTLAMVISPDEGYTAGETSRLRSFVRSGGSLLVATDFRPDGRALLDALGANATVSAIPLRDEQRYGPGPAFPVAPDVTTHAYTLRVDSLVLNHAASIDPNGATVLVASSPYAYRDVNRNGELDDEETLGRHAVVTIEPEGDGEIIAVSDPSLFINAMLERGHNRRFLGNLVGGHERVLVDVSHANAVPPLVGIALTVRDSALLQLLAGVLVLGGLVALEREWVAALVERLRGEAAPPAVEITEADLATAIRQRHEDWDEDRIDRVTEGIIRRQDVGEEDE